MEVIINVTCKFQEKKTVYFRNTFSVLGKLPISSLKETFKSWGTVLQFQNVTGKELVHSKNVTFTFQKYFLSSREVFFKSHDSNHPV